MLLIIPAKPVRNGSGLSDGKHGALGIRVNGTFVSEKCAQRTYRWLPLGPWRTKGVLPCTS